MGRGNPAREQKFVEVEFNTATELKKKKKNKNYIQIKRKYAIIHQTINTEILKK